MPVLIAETTENPVMLRMLAPGYTLRACQSADSPALGRLYFACYPEGVIESTPEEAYEDIERTFGGGYGDLWLAASPLIEAGGEPVCAALTVHRAPWEDVPVCPFIVEVFTANAQRRRGLASAAIAHILTVARAAGEVQVSLRVDDDSVAARALYARLGFHSWQGACS